MKKRLNFLWSIIKYANGVYNEAIRLGANHISADIGFRVITDNESGSLERWYSEGRYVSLHKSEYSPLRCANTRSS